MAKLKKIFVLDNYGFEISEIRIDFDNDRHYGQAIQGGATPEQVLLKLRELAAMLEYDIKNGVFE